jgi:hypothetical protein
MIAGAAYECGGVWRKALDDIGVEAVMARHSRRGVLMPARPRCCLGLSFMSGNHRPNRARVHAHPGARFSNGLEAVGIVWTGGSFSIDAETLGIPWIGGHWI